MAKVDLLARVKAAAQSGVERTQSETLDATIIDVVPAPSVVDKDGNEIRKIRVITKEFGSMWCFESNLINGLSSYGDGVKAKLTVVPNKYTKDGVEVEGFNLQRAVVQAMDSKIEAMIKAMPKGAALFGAV